jgi:hypothetical protein
MIIKRHAAPNIFDEAPKDTLCVVEDYYGHELERWIQRSDDTEHPRWEKI